MEIRLHDNSRLVFTWVRGDLLNIELWRPGDKHDGRGWILSGSALLAGDELSAWLSELHNHRCRHLTQKLWDVVEQYPQAREQ